MAKDHLGRIIPQQHQEPPPCPTCKRPVYIDVEHNPVCAAVQNLESLLYKGAGQLEEDQAQRWADLHERITGEKHEVVENMRVEIEALKQRITAVEELATKPAGERTQKPEPAPEKPGDEPKPGEPAQPTA